jgi:hypothetical protein
MTEPGLRIAMIFLQDIAGMAWVWLHFYILDCHHYRLQTELFVFRAFTLLDRSNGYETKLLLAENEQKALKFAGMYSETSVCCTS